VPYFLAVFARPIRPLALLRRKKGAARRCTPPKLSNMKLQALSQGLRVSSIVGKGGDPNDTVWEKLGGRGPRERRWA
jgi:hypothetical protein